MFSTEKCCTVKTIAHKPNAHRYVDAFRVREQHSAFSTFGVNARRALMHSTFEVFSKEVFILVF